MKCNFTFKHCEEILKDKRKALEYWYDGMAKVLENNNVNIIAHPTAILKRNSIDIPSDMKVALAQKAAKYNKNFEVNTKYVVPDDKSLGLLRHYNVKLIMGSDSHSIVGMRANASALKGMAEKYEYTTG